MYRQRINLCELLQYISDGIENREKDIKDQLREISLKEMQKGHEEDQLQNQTLKTIEVINIADIQIEKTNLERLVNQMTEKQVHLRRDEEQLLKEQRRREARKKKDERKRPDL
jgi:hypothetical protein